MSNFYTSIKIEDKIVQVQELKLKHYKVLQKALLGADEDFTTLILNFTKILEQLTSLTYQELLDLSYISYCKLLFFIRSISMGNIINANTTDETPVKIVINTENIIKKINNLTFEKYLQPLDKNTLHLSLKLPTITNILENNNYNDPSLLKFIYFTNLDKSILDIEKFEYFYENLPVNIFVQINKHIDNLIQYIQGINLIDENITKEKNISLPLTYDITNIVLIFQLLFTTNLSTLYENIFALSKMANMPPSYLEECTPGEYNLYVSLLQAILKTHSAPKSQNITSSDTDPTPNFM